jgi:pyruvate/2-oxoglutarate/acetoin dehydrogenase E1 component
MSQVKPHYAGKVEYRLSDEGKSFRRALAEALREEILRDESVFLLGEDIGKNGGPFGVTLGFYEEFGEERVRDTPISEVAIVGLATGAALLGMRPVAEIMFLDFIFTAMDQIVNNVAKMRYIYGEKGKLPLVIRAACGSGLQAGPTHGQSLYSMFVHVPGLKVIVPATPYDAKGLLIAAIRDDDPVLFFEHMRLYTVKDLVPDGSYVLPLGKGEVRRVGRDVTVVATMALMYAALAAADELDEQGISLEVIDPRTLVPFDIDIVVESVRKTGRLIVADESPIRGGVQGEVISLVIERAFDYLDAPPVRLGTLNAPIPFSPSLEREIVPGKDRIIKAARELIRRG